MLACINVLLIKKTLSGTDRLHSSAVNPRPAHQGWRLGTSESKSFLDVLCAKGCIVTVYNLKQFVTPIAPGIPRCRSKTHQHGFTHFHTGIHDIHDTGSQQYCQKHYSEYLNRRAAT